MPQLGMDASKQAPASGNPTRVSSEGIRKTMPLMKRKELAVAKSEMAMIDQRTIMLGWLVAFGWSKSNSPFSGTESCANCIDKNIITTQAKNWLYQMYEMSL
jgi:hypothetical protein